MKAMSNKHEILKGKKLTKHQKNILKLISDSSKSNYILEVWDMNTLKSTFTVVNGEDDFEDIRESTMNKLLSFKFLLSKQLPSSFKVIRTKYYIPERFKVQVYLACLQI